jgi:hypothetical protein
MASQPSIFALLKRVNARLQGEEPDAEGSDLDDELDEVAPLPEGGEDDVIDRALGPVAKGPQGEAQAAFKRGFNRARPVGPRR